MDILKIELYDDIGARYYNWITDEYVDLTFKGLSEQIKSYEGSQIEVFINSFGGSVLEGLGIYNALIGHKANVTTKIVGYAISMASVIAMAGDTVEMPENSWFMIHEPWGGVQGDANDMRMLSDLLDSMGNQIAGIYSKKSKVHNKTEFRSYMKNEKWFDGKQAKKAGLVDTVTKGVSIAANFNKQDFNNMPQGLVDIINKQSKDKKSKMDYKAKYEAFVNKAAVFFGKTADEMESFDFENAFSGAATTAVEKVLETTIENKFKPFNDIAAKFAEDGEFTQILNSAKVLADKVTAQDELIKNQNTLIEAQNKAISDQKTATDTAVETIKSSFSDDVATAVAKAIEDGNHNAGGSIIDTANTNNNNGIKTVKMPSQTAAE